MTLSINSQQQFNMVNQSQSWFNVYDLDRRVYAIVEPYQTQKVISYLIIGDNQAILLDTGMGIGNIKKLVFELWSLYPIVINSNACAGHSGGNYKFNNVKILNEPKIIDTLTFGYDSSWVDKYYNKNTFMKDAPKKEINFEPCTFTTISDGVMYTLGNKDIEVIAPKDLQINGLMLVDHSNKMLFTGDIFYQPVIDILDEDTKTKYMEALKDIVNKYADYTWLFSHGTPIDKKLQEELINIYK